MSEREEPLSPNSKVALTPTVSGPNAYFLEPVNAESSTGPKKTFVDYANLVLHHKVVLAICVLAGMAVSIMAILKETPLYRASATIEIRTPKTGASLINVGGSEFELADTGAELETQIRILESGKLADRVRARLRAENPNRVYEVRDVFAGWRRRLGLPAKTRRIQVAVIPEVTTKAVVLGTSRIVQLTCESWDPKLTADYANALANEYILYNQENLGESMNQISSWLAKQVRDARDQLEQSENQLQTYTRDENLVYTGDEKEESAEHKKLRQLQEDLAKATADRIVKQAAYETARSGPVNAIPDVANNEHLNAYETKLSNLQWQLQDLRRQYTDEHYKVKAVMAQIRDVQANIDQERRAIVERIRTEYEQSRNVEQMLSSAYAAQLPKASNTAQKGIQYGLMKWDVDTNRRVYEELLQRVKATSIGSSLQANNSVVLDSAKIPPSPFRPAVTRYVGTGTLAGLLVGVLAIFMGEFVNRNLKAPGEAAFHLGVPELGVIPSHESTLLHRPSAVFPKLLGSEGDRGHVELVTWEDRPSPMAEAYRSTLASILLSSNGQRHQVVLVTSSGRGEGKSSTVSNLGLALAEIRQRVLLIDADLRKPSLHTIFKVANTWGLSDVLREKTSLKDSPLEALARATSIENLYVLPSGPGAISIASLFYSDRMAALIDRLRREFDAIIIDTPPISYLSDARFVGQVADSAVLVVRAGVTSRDAAIATQQRLKEDGIPLLGTILNAWDGRAKSRYSYSYSSYPYDQAPED